MAQIPQLQSTNNLGTDDQAILRQGTIDKRISLELAGTLSWAKRNGFTHVGSHVQGLSFTSTEDFSTFQGKVYFVKASVSLPYTSTTTDPSTETDLYTKDETSLNEVIATGSTVSRSLSNRFADIVNVRDFGAVGDGVTDDTAAIQAALEVGGNIFIPTGTYNISSALEVRNNTTVYNRGTLVATGILVGLECVILVRNAVNVEVHGADIDCGGFAANSGIIVRETTSEVRLYNTTVRNAAWDATRGGGRGIIIESNSGAPANIIVDGLYCTLVDTVFALNGHTGSRKNNVVVSNIVASDCEKLLALFGNGTGYPHSGDSQGCTINNVSGNNIRQPIRFDRAANARITNVNVFNQNTVTISSFIQGHCNNVVFEGTYEHQTGGTTVQFVYNNTSWKDDGTQPDQGFNTEKCVFSIKFIGRAQDLLAQGYTGDRCMDTVFNVHVDEVASELVSSVAFNNNTSVFVDVYNSEHNCRITGFVDDISSTQFSAVAGNDYSPARRIGGLYLAGSTAIPTTNNIYTIGSATNRLADIYTFNGVHTLAPNGTAYRIGVSSAGVVTAYPI